MPSRFFLYFAFVSVFASSLLAELPPKPVTDSNAEDDEWEIPAAAKTAVAAAAPAASTVNPLWPSLTQIRSLYEAKNYAAIRAATARLTYDPATQANLLGAQLLFYRGDALLREVYQARAEQSPEADTPIALGRNSFELTYDASTARALDTALADLKISRALETHYNGTPYRAEDAALRAAILPSFGLAALEKALFVTQDPQDFYLVSDA
jgi:hypothetical protein